MQHPKTSGTARPCPFACRPRRRRSGPRSELADRGDRDAGVLADPGRVGAAEVGVDVERVRVEEVAGAAQGPAAAGLRAGRPGRPGRPARPRTRGPRPTARATSRGRTSADSRAETVAGSATPVLSRSCNTRARALITTSWDVTMTIVTPSGHQQPAVRVEERPARRRRAPRARRRGGHRGAVPTGCCSAPTPRTATGRPTRRSSRRSSRRPTCRSGWCCAPATDHFPRLVVLGETFLELGAQGLAFGFLDRDLEIDRASCAEMCAELGGVPWIFHGFDAALDADHAWRDVLGAARAGLGRSPAGSTRGLAHGADELIARASRDPRVAALVTAGGGLTPEQVPWLVRCRRTPLRDRVLGPRRRLVDPGLGRRRPGPVVADARRRRPVAGARHPDRLTGGRVELDSDGLGRDAARAPVVLTRRSPERFPVLRLPAIALDRRPGRGGAARRSPAVDAGAGRGGRPGPSPGTSAPILSSTTSGLQCGSAARCRATTRTRPVPRSGSR